MRLCFFLKRIIGRKPSPKRMAKQTRTKHVAALPMPGLILVDEQGKHLSGEMINVAKNGIGFCLNQPVEHGDTLYLTTTASRIELIVAWSSKQPSTSGKYRCGCFTKSETVDLQQILQNAWSVDGF